MDIAAMSTQMAMQNVQMAISNSMLKKTMEQGEASMEILLQGLENAQISEPSFNKLDVRA